LIGSPAKAQFVYGGGRDGNIYEIDLAAKTTTVLISTGFTGLGGTGVADGLANDTTRNNLFYFDPNSNLQVLGQGQAARQVASAAQLGTGGLQPQNAAFWNNNLWFFSRDSNVLNQVSFTYPVDNTPVFGAVTQFTLSNVPNTGLNTGNSLNNFGDIAITSEGLLFAVTNGGNGSNINRTGRLYTLDLTSLDATTINGTYTQIDGNLGAGGLQIAFNENYSVLFANRALGLQPGQTGSWSTIDTSNGDITAFSPTFVTTVTSPDGTFGFLDLSDSVTPVRIPGPLPLLGAAAALGWSRKLRNRVKGSR
jgi:hypothetical protein